MSVLVDERFGGSWDDLRAAREATMLPLLLEASSTPGDLRTARGGADAVLLPCATSRPACAARIRARTMASTRWSKRTMRPSSTERRARRAGDRRQRADLPPPASTGTRSSSCSHAYRASGP
jgi:hypothetical protein